MTNALKLYVFGDQTFDVHPHLREFIHNGGNSVLKDFLTKAYDVIRTELFNLPKDVREKLPRFGCINDILLWDGTGKPCVPLEMAVTCMFQLATFIREADSRGYSLDDTRVIGLCTGALTAATVSCCRNTIELVPLGLCAIRAAFLIGLRAMEAAQQITPSNTPGGESWSRIFLGSADVKTAMEEFVKNNMLPTTRKPYVSAVMLNAVTVSGPPDILARFEEFASSRGLNSSKLSIDAPYHAAHIYSERDVKSITGRLFSQFRDNKKAQIPLIPSTTFQVDSKGNFREALEAAIVQILLHPLQSSSMIDEIESLLRDPSAVSLEIHQIGTKAGQTIQASLKHSELHTKICLATPSERHSSGASSECEKAKIAIIGMSGRFPDAQDNEAFWNILYQGLDVHKPAPALHWDISTHVDLTGTRKNTSATPYGCWLNDPAAFDARFFNISPREAPQIDPAQRLALMTAFEASEQAGLVPDATASTRRDRVGVFYGVTSNDWMETNSAQDINPYFIPGGNRAFIPGRINYFYKFSGPSYAVDTACSSSLAGIHLACNALWQKDADTAIAGGTNILTNPDFTAGLDRGHFLSRTGNCKTFDDTADGYCRGEGVGTVILKRLDDAIAENDPILGVIVNAATNHSAEAESITRPHSAAQSDIFRKILNQGGVDPLSIGYVEMHGTGTQVGDTSEMCSVLETFAPPLSEAKSQHRDSASPLYIGSAKANIGHGEAASGVSSLIKSLLMMQKNIIVPHCGIKTKINHRFPTDLQERHVHIAVKPTPWERSPDPAKPRRIFVNNFSAAGGNSALLLEDAPLRREQPSHTDVRNQHLVAISAKNGTSLQGNLRSMLQYLKDNPETPIGKLSYTTTARRIHHQHRVMLLGQNIDEIANGIDTAIRDQIGMTRPAGAPKIVFTFTGQGAQYPGMGRGLYETFSVFRTTLCELDQLAQQLGFTSFLHVIHSEEKDFDAFAPLDVQLAGVCMQIALCRLWAAWGIVPTAVVGHSLGEYAALNVAGVLSDADTVYLVGSRASLLQKRCTAYTHNMLVVRGSVDDIQAQLKNATFAISCINSSVETVVSGPEEEVLNIQALLTDSGRKSTMLRVPYAFHSSQVDPILEEFEQLAGGVVFAKPKIPVISPLDATIIEEEGIFGPNYLIRHTREPVNMIKTLLAAKEAQKITEKTLMLEVGPHPAVSGMVRQVLGSQITCIPSCQRGRPALSCLTTALKTVYTAGADIAWSKYHADFSASHEVLPLPAYSWDLKPYWLQYVNDWSLRKGDPANVVSSSPALESTTIHKIVGETGDAQKMNIVVEADIKRKDLSPLVQGHEVDGIPLCTPSVYADIALSLGTFLLKRHRPNQKENLVDVSDMTISKALILRAGASQQLLQAHAEVDWTTNSVLIKFCSFDLSEKLQEHSRCVVRFKDRTQLAVLQGKLANVKEKIKTLHEDIITGASARFNRPMVYRAIRPLARFHDDYRAIDEIVLNSKTLEATSRLSFGSVKRGGSYHTHPAIIDSLTQSCGFAMNCNDNTDLDVDVFMNHGWGSFQIFEPLNFEKSYTTYTQMLEGKDKLWHGDVVILDGDKVVAFFGQIAIQNVPRRVLQIVLAIEQKGAGPKKSRPTQVASTPASITQNKNKQGQEHLSQSKAEPQTTSKFPQALKILAEESGIDVAELTDSTNFADAGVDSLLSLVITSRFKDELDVDLDFNAFVYEYPTVGQLKSFLTKGESPTQSSTGPTPSLAGDYTPSISPDSGGPATPYVGESGAESSVDFHRVLEIVAEESGIAVGDLRNDTSLVEAGVDSLLSLIIASRLHSELGLEIQQEDLFMNCSTVKNLRDFVSGPEEAKPLSALDSGAVALTVREKAVDEYVRKYTAGFSVPAPASSIPSVQRGNEKVVLVTGGTGSLGGHLVDQIAQMPDVKTVICINRANPRSEPYARQQKAMRDKGIRTFDKIKDKLLVYQTDSAQPQLGLPRDQYEAVVSTVTHLIHNAWPMSAKRAVEGFEPQFQIMRNLIDLACDAITRRPNGFQFSFEMVSSIGTVGHYGLGNGQVKTLIPEADTSIEAVLPNGYSDAKWVCERMLRDTLQSHPVHFRAFVARLGQIAGSKTSGYWNPMEHFAFLIKSSQTLGVLPDVPGTVHWTPVNDVAGSLADLVLSDRKPYPVYHVENPRGQLWSEVNTVLADALGISSLIPFAEWTERVRLAGQRNNPAATLLQFLDHNYLRLSCGGAVLDVTHSLEHSSTLAALGPVSEEVIRKYVHVWKEIGFLMQ